MTQHDYPRDNGFSAMRLSRRALLRQAAALGLTAPAIAGLLTRLDSAPDAANAGAGVPPRGRQLAGGMLRLRYWQAPTILNPHLAQATKDIDASLVCLEPLAYFDDRFQPILALAAEWPSVENGLLAADGTRMTWRLRQDVRWHDGHAFMSADVAFTYQWLSHPDLGATSTPSYARVIAVEQVDDFTVDVRFDGPTPDWYVPFTGGAGAILPEHIFRDYLGANGRDALANIAPVGTGPWRYAEFRPGDYARFERFADYWEPNRPYFDEVEIIGGGDPASAARAVLQTGEADWAWNVQIEKAVLDELERDAIGQVMPIKRPLVERVLINFADPNTDVDGIRSEPVTRHPFLSDLRVRQAFALASDRNGIGRDVYGKAGEATANLLTGPPQFVSPNTSHAFDVAAANALLDRAGWVRAGDVRVKDGLELTGLYQTTVNPTRQHIQEILQSNWQQIGARVELKSVDAGVFFSSDAGNPDTAAHFYADFEMYSDGPLNPYPIGYMQRYASLNPATDLAQFSNNWSGPNINRWVNEEFNALYQQAQTELNPRAQADLFVAMNDLVVNEVVDIPLVRRNELAAIHHRLRGWSISAWASTPMFALKHVYRVGDPVEAFERTWARTDQPIAAGRTARTWMWGPSPLTNLRMETYDESPDGQRAVRYYDKARMELTDPDGDPDAPWFVTTGLLVVELMTGLRQVGNGRFESHAPAEVSVAGDDDAQGPTFAMFAPLRATPPLADGATIIQRINRLGQVSDDADVAAYGVRAAYRVQMAGIDHQVAAPFWSFMNASGLVYENGQYVEGALFLNPFYATGYPITEAYWATVNVGGRPRDVLIQCFERRVLTYTPDNPPSWQVESGNVGRHYQVWRYGT